MSEETIVIDGSELDVWALAFGKALHERMAQLMRRPVTAEEWAGVVMTVVHGSFTEAPPAFPGLDALTTRLAEAEKRAGEAEERVAYACAKLGLDTAPTPALALLGLIEHAGVTASGLTAIEEVNDRLRATGEALLARTAELERQVAVVHGVVRRAERQLGVGTSLLAGTVPQTADALLAHLAEAVAVRDAIRDIAATALAYDQKLRTEGAREERARIVEAAIEPLVNGARCRLCGKGHFAHGRPLVHEPTCPLALDSTGKAGG